MIGTLLVILLLIYFFVKLIGDPFPKKCNCTTKLYGKVALVTGGNTGIGFETAKDLASRGAQVIIASRNLKRSKEAVEEIISATGNHKVEYKYLDLISFKNIKQFAEDFNKTYDRLDVLVNNAGCMALPNESTEDGIDSVMQINYFGAFLLTNLLVPKLIKSKPSRIVIVSSMAQHLVLNLNCEDLVSLQKRWFNNNYTRYNTSKLLQILWTKALAKRLPEGVTINALHPGIVKTDLFNTISSSVFRFLVNVVLYVNFITPKEGAQTVIHLCVAEELANKTGQYYASCKPIYTSLLVNNDLVERVWKESLRITKTEMEPDELSNSIHQQIE